MEQLERSRLVIVACLAIGMASLWTVLFLVSWLIATLLPREVVEGWLSVTLTAGHLARFAAFAATLGVAAGALGGNLEDENALKARFFFDEES